MVFFALFLVLHLVACDNSKATNNRSSQMTSYKDGENADSTQSVQTPVGETYVLGGPADFTITFTHPVVGSYYLICVFGDQNLRVDSTNAVNNSIRFQNSEGYSQGLYYAVDAANRYVQFILGEDQIFQLTTNMDDPLATQVVGSKENELFFAVSRYDQTYEDEIAPFKQMIQQQPKSSKTYQEAKARINSFNSDRDQYLCNIFDQHPELLFSVFKRAGQNPKINENLPEDQQVLVFREQYWDNVDFADLRLIYTPVILNKLNSYFTQLTVQRPDSIKASADRLLARVFEYPVYYKFFANWIALKYEPTKTTLMDSEAIFVHMVQNYFTYDRAYWSDSASTYALQLRAYEMSKSLVGQKGPDVTANDPEGNPQSIHAMTTDYLLVYLFNPTCEHCLVETPKLIQLFNQQGSDKLFDVYSIAVDTDIDEWINYVEKNRFPFTTVFDPTNESIYAKYFVDITPELYVLNKKRTIIAKNIKVDQVMQVIERDQNQ